jgi:cell division protein FtsI/penicillin-binding protein 2
MTMLQLAAFTGAIANGGTLYYLQYPTQEQLANFQPRVKRDLEIEASLAVVRSGMEGAVLTGTARRAQQRDIHVLGKTGTCSQGTARLGWFAGYNREPGGVAMVVLLRTGVRLGGGPRASQVAGEIFSKLGSNNFYARHADRSAPQILPASIHLPAIP